MTSRDMYRSDDSEESDEGENGGRMLGFLFGNIDETGALEEEYLDELASVEGKVQNKITDSDVFEEKAADAVDYADIDEALDEEEEKEDPLARFQSLLPISTAMDIDEDDYDAPEPTKTTGETGEPLKGTPVEEESKDVGMVKRPNAKAQTKDADGKSLKKGKKKDKKEKNLKKEPPKPEDIKKKLPVLFVDTNGKEVLKFTDIFLVSGGYWEVLNREAKRRGHKKKRYPRPPPADPAPAQEHKSLEYLRSGVVPKSVWDMPGQKVTKMELELQDKLLAMEEAGEDVSSLRSQSGTSKFSKKSTDFKSLVEDPVLAQEIFQKNLESINMNDLALVQQVDWEKDIIWEVPERKYGGFDVVEDEALASSNKKIHKTKEDEFWGEDEFGEKEEEDEGDEMDVDELSEKDKKEEELREKKRCKEEYLLWLKSRPVVVEPLEKDLSEREMMKLLKKKAKEREKNRHPLKYRHPSYLRIENWDLLGANDEQTVAARERISRLLSRNIVCYPGDDRLYLEDFLDKDNGGEAARGVQEGDEDEEMEMEDGVNFLKTLQEVEEIPWMDIEDYAGEGAPSPKIIFDFNDSKMTFEVPDTEEFKELREHSLAKVIKPHAPEENVVDFGDMECEEFYENGKNNKNNKKKIGNSNKPVVYHSLPAQRLETMKPKLSNKDLAHFHRPLALWFPPQKRLDLSEKERGGLLDQEMKIIIRTLPGKNIKLRIHSTDSVEILRAKCIKKLGDFLPNEPIKLMFEGRPLNFQETLRTQLVPPSAVVYLVRPQLTLLPRAHLSLPSENQPRRPPGAFKRKAELSAKDGHIILTEYCEEYPLILSNVGMGARLTTYYKKTSPTDQGATELRSQQWTGLHMPLEPQDDSPFLGEVAPGTSQTALETNLFHAPTFPHKVPSTDFLLVRNAKGKLTLRKIDALNVVGQQEPYMEVLNPAPKTVQAYLGSRLLVFMFREFLDFKKSGYLPRVRAEDVSANFPALNDAFIKKKLKPLAELQRGEGGQWWWVMKRSLRLKSEAEIRQMLTPEQVCLYEAMLAGQYRLKTMGVYNLTTPAGIPAASKMLPDDPQKMAAASLIERALQVAPWNLTHNFVGANSQGKGGLERLEIVGPGDPTGRGLGFSFVRLPGKQGNGAKADEEKKKAGAEKKGGTVTGTDADLRRVSMDRARELLLGFGVKDEEIKKMTRWKRIAMVRSLSSNGGNVGGRGGEAGGMSKFARGQRRSTMQLQQIAKQKCQEIWEKQATNLREEGEEFPEEEEEEEDEELDLFAGDLENLLEQQGGKMSEKDKRGEKGGLRGRRNREEEEREDEEAEAAELRKLLMDDDDEKEQKKKKEEKKPPVAKPQKEEAEPVEEKLSKKKKKVKKLKKLVKTRHEDGTVTIKEVIVDDPKQVAAYLAKKEKEQAVQNERQVANPEKPTEESQVKKPRIIVKAPKKDKETESEIVQKPTRAPVICGACKQEGHMKTNRKLCPLYGEKGGDQSGPSALPVSGRSQKDSTRVKIKFPSKPAGSAAEDEGQVNPEEEERDKVVSEKDKEEKEKIEKERKEKERLEKEIMEKVKAEKEKERREFERLEKERKEKEKLEKEKIRMEKLKEKREKEKAERERKKALEEQRRAERQKKRAQEELEKAERRKAEEEQQKKLEEMKEKSTTNLVPAKRAAPEIPKVKLPAAKLPKLKPKSEIAQESEKLAHKQNPGSKEKIGEVSQPRDFLETSRKGGETLNVRKVEPNLPKIKPTKEHSKEPSEVKVKRKREDEPVQREASEKPRPAEKKAPEKTQSGGGTGLKVKIRIKHLNQPPPETSQKAEASVKQVETVRKVEESEVQDKPEKNQALMKIFDQVLAAMYTASNVNFMFLQPVDANEVPDYYQIIDEPMYVDEINLRNKQGYYNSRQEFMRDVKLIADNAHTYNDTRHTWIPPLADKLVQLCEKELRKKSRQLAEAEGLVGAPPAGKRVKRL